MIDFPLAALALNGIVTRSCRTEIDSSTDKTDITSLKQAEESPRNVQEGKTESSGVVCSITKHTTLHRAQEEETSTSHYMTRNPYTY